MNLTIRDLASFDDFKQAEAVEREVWEVSDRDVVPLALAIATKEAGNLWLGGFDGAKLAGFAFAFLGLEEGRLTLHSHLLAVRRPYRDLNLGYKLKQAQRERALALGIHKITWTFDPLQSKNAHFNFAKLGVVADRYKPDFYGRETSSILHRNGTDRLWVTWALGSRRVQSYLQGKAIAAKFWTRFPSSLRSCCSMAMAARPAPICPRQSPASASPSKSPVTLPPSRSRILH